MSSPATLSIYISSLIILLVHLFSSFPATAAESTPTVYEELEEYDFPVGLLPVGVTGYELDKSSGKFKAYLKETCTFTIKGYDLKYKSTISGVIEKGKLKNLKGISVRILILWLNIVEVSRNGDEIDFSVGILSAGFGFASFIESPQCGCGFECNSIAEEREEEAPEEKMGLPEFLISSL